MVLGMVAHMGDGHKVEPPDGGTHKEESKSGTADGGTHGEGFETTNAERCTLAEGSKEGIAVGSEHL